MKYGSVCSGIEAATAAWHCLGFQPIWFAENVPNLGDMTEIAELVRRGEV